MRLEMQSMKVDYLIAGEKTCAEKENLYVNIEELREHLCEDDKLVSLDIRVIDKDNDDTRFVNVIDVIQPRCKLDGGENFPGFVGKIETAGKGVTRSLDDVIVVVCNATPGKGRTVQKFFDTGGTGARLTEYSSKNILYMCGETVEGLTDNEHEDVLRIAGMKAAVYLAERAGDLAVSDTEVYDLDLYAQDEDTKDLPRICYYYQVYAPHYDYGNDPSRVLYGQTVTEMPPTILHPNEILDGAMSGVHIQSYCTYDNQNHGIIKELYKRHKNKEIVFCGVVIGVLSMSEVRRGFFVKQTGKLIKDVLNADGVILTKFHGGAAHLDSALVAIECEKLGVSTSMHITSFTDVGKLADNLVYADESLNLIIAGFTYFAPVDIHFEYKNLLGASPDSFASSWRATSCNTPLGSVDLKIEAIFVAGYTDFLGRTKVRAMEY